jgi:hypothetical protein
MGRVEGNGREEMGSINNNDTEHSILISSIQK